MIKFKTLHRSAYHVKSKRAVFFATPVMESVLQACYQVAGLREATSAQSVERKSTG